MIAVNGTLPNTPAFLNQTSQLVDQVNGNLTNLYVQNLATDQANLAALQAAIDQLTAAWNANKNQTTTTPTTTVPTVTTVDPRLSLNVSLQAAASSLDALLNDIINWQGNPVNVSSYAAQVAAIKAAISGNMTDLLINTFAVDVSNLNAIQAAIAALTNDWLNYKSQTTTTVLGKLELT
jgi:hypothetical protein